MNIRIGNQKATMRAIPVLIAIYCALIPLENVLAVSWGGSLNKYVGLLIMGLVVVWFLRNERRTVWLPVGIVRFAILAFCSIVWTPHPQAQIILSVMLNAMIFTLVAMQYPLLDTEKELIIDCIFLGGVAVAILMLSGSSFTVINTIDRDRMSFVVRGLVIDNNNLATSLSLCCISGISRIYKKRRSILAQGVYIIGVALIAMAILRTGSRGGLLALVAGGIAFLVLSDSGIKLRTLLIGAICAFAAAYYIQNYFSAGLASRFTITEVMSSGGTGRIQIWINGLRIFCKSSPLRWIFGYGFGSFGYVMNDYYGIIKAAHNDMIQILLELGILGLAFYLMMWWGLMKDALHKKDAIAVSLLVVIAVGSLSMEMLIKKMLWMVFYLSIAQQTDTEVQNTKKL